MGIFLRFAASLARHALLCLRHHLLPPDPPPHHALDGITTARAFDAHVAAPRRIDIISGALTSWAFVAAARGVYTLRCRAFGIVVGSIHIIHSIALYYACHLTATPSLCVVRRISPTFRIFAALFLLLQPYVSGARPGRLRRYAHMPRLRWDSPPPAALPHHNSILPLPRHLPPVPLCSGLGRKEKKFF